MASPLLAIHKPELVNGRWAMSVKFSVKGQPVELVVHASQALGDKLVNYGKARLDKYVAFGGVARCCKSCEDNSRTSFGGELDDFSGVMDVVNRVASDPAVGEAIGASTPVDESVRQYRAIMDSLSDPEEASNQQLLLQQVYSLAMAGDEPSYKWLSSMMEVGACDQLLQGVEQGDSDATATVQSIQLGAMQGDIDSIHQYLTLQGLMQGATPMLVLHDADQEKTPIEASVEIGRSLMSQRTLGSRARAAVEMIRAAMKRMISKVHPGPTLVSAPYRPLLAY